jgi:hypothetical protein
MADVAYDSFEFEEEDLSSGRTMERVVRCQNARWDAATRSNRVAGGRGRLE